MQKKRNHQSSLSIIVIARLKRLKKILLTLIFLILSHYSYGQTADEHIEQNINTQDIKQTEIGGKILAVPIPVSNPTLGTGLQGVVLYLHPPKPGGSDTPNATSGILTMVTNTDSWLIGGFHDNYLFRDRLRARSAIGTSEMHVEYFGSGSDPLFADKPIKYSLKADMGLFQGLVRVPSTKSWYSGLRYFFLNSDIHFDTTALDPRLPDVRAESNSANLALVINFDNRDNNYYPTKGHFLDVKIARDDEAWASDYDFTRNTLGLNQYIEIFPEQVLAARIYATQIDGTAPFYLLPSLNLRGFAHGRYQDNAVGSMHIEWRYKFRPRWGVMLSYETGGVADKLNQLTWNDRVESVGLGIRWQATKEQPMNLGIDVGFSDGDKAVYVKIGEKF